MLAELSPSVPRIAQRCVVWFARRKFPTALTLGGGAALVVFVVAMAHSAGFVALFDAPLHTAQATEIEQALTLWGEPFSTNSQGTQVFVSAARRRDLLLRLTLAGLPRHYVPTSSDVLDVSQNPLSPESIIDDHRRSGIQGDIVASLRRIDGIVDASVVISPGESDLFSDQRNAPPTASVQVIMRPDARLSPTAIAGVRRFVAAAYPALLPDRVTLVDASGIAQDARVDDSGASRERRIQTAVQTALDSVLGQGATVVRVSIRSTGVEESVQSTRLTPHGVLDADIGRERGTERGRAFDKERTNRHYAFDTVLDRRTSKADAAARMSVAVFLDSRRIDPSVSRTVLGLVRAAAGASLKAGDEVVVQTMPFALKPPPKAAAAVSSTALSGVAVPVLSVCALFALLSAALLRRRASTNAPMRQDADDRTVSSIRATLKAELPRTAAYVLGALPERLRERVLRSYDPTRRQQIETHLACASDACDVL